jgi:hypothetical protein
MEGQHMSFRRQLWTIAAASCFAWTADTSAPAADQGAAATAENSEAQIATLIEQLGNDDFAVRQRTQSQLSRMGLQAFDALVVASQHHQSIEVKMRAGYLVRGMTVRWFDESDPPEVARLLKSFGTQDEKERRSRIDRLGSMTDLASMVVETGVGLINVVHLKRKETGNKDRGLNEGGQVSLTDLRGSAALEQLSWAVLAMERNQQAEDGSEDYSYLRVLKNRTWGRTGKAGRVKYVHETGRLVDAPEEIENNEVHGVSTPEEVVEEERKSCIEELDAILSGTSFSGSEERLSA